MKDWYLQIIKQSSGFVAQRIAFYITTEQLATYGQCFTEPYYGDDWIKLRVLSHDMIYK